MNNKREQTSDFYDIALTQVEYNAMLHEVAERFNNIVYAIATEKANEALAALNIKPGGTLRHMYGMQEITITLPLTMVRNDIAEIIAGIRRPRPRQKRRWTHMLAMSR